MFGLLLQNIYTVYLIPTDHDFEFVFETQVMSTRKLSELKASANMMTKEINTDNMT